MNSNTYWFVTGISNRTKHPTERTRCWGFFDDFTEAEQAVLANDGDIFENEFEHMVIEGHRMGIMGMMNGQQYWYWFDKETERFISIDTPDWAAGVVGWGIG